MSLPFIQLNQGLGQYTVASALSVLQLYSPRVAMQFLDARGSLWTDTARTTPAANLGDSVRGVTNYVTGQPHGAQSNDARRPLYGKYPITGRRNMFQFTEEFNNGYWTKANATIVENVAANPISGISDADRITTSAGFGEARVGPYTSTGNHTLTCYVKNESMTTFLLRLDRDTNTANMTFTFATEAVTTSGANVISASATSVGDGWYRLRVTGNVTSTSWLAGITGGAATGSALIWGAQIELGSSATNYQRVGTIADVTEIGVRSTNGLVFDGTDDQIILTGLNMSDTNRLSVIVGLRKLADGVDRNVLQLTVGSTNGEFSLSAPGSSAVARYQGLSRGTTPAVPFTTSTAFNAPHTAQIELTANISTPFARLRVNGTQVSNIVTSQGTGNYANSDLFIGLRSAGTEPLNAVLNYIFVCGEVIPDSIGDQIRRGFASQTGIPST